MAVLTLIVLLMSSGFSTAQTTNTASTTIRAPQARKIALQYLEKYYPEIVPQRFVFVDGRGPDGPPDGPPMVEQGQVLVTFTDRAAIKKYQSENRFFLIYTTWYHISLGSDGKLIYIREEHLTDAGFKEALRRSLVWLDGGPPVTLPKSVVADAWN